MGTDGRRLAKQEGPAKAVGGHETGDNTTIIPTRAMQLIERALADNEEKIQLAARDNDVLVRSRRVTIYSRLVEGRYPKWRDVFPAARGHGEDRVDRRARSMRRSARRPSSPARNAAASTSPSARVRWCWPATGPSWASRTSSCRSPTTGPTIPINLDPRFFSDFLKVLDPEQTFTLELKDAESAAVCSTDDGYGYVIMPLARDQ